MSGLLERLDAKKQRDVGLLANFVAIYCRNKHDGSPKAPLQLRDEQLAAGANTLTFCPDCRRLLTHGIAKLNQCPYDPRPSCRRCRTHCYAPGYRAEVRRVMRFSGMYLIRRGRLDLLFHYLR